MNYDNLGSGVDEGIKEMLEEKDRLISLQERDMMSLKREINDLKKQLSHSKRQKK